MSGSSTVLEPARLRGGVAANWPALLVGLLGLGLVFRQEIAAAVGVWSTSTAYGHCYFVIPIALYLAWDRRRLWLAQPAAPMPRALLLAVPLAAAWLVAERLGLMEGRQLAAIGFVELLFLVVLGPALWWALSAALLYLVFLVPFGAFLTASLQDVTAGFVDVGLTVLGIPHYSDALTIEVEGGTFYVAEACAGLRFLIASIAFGVLYACLLYRSPGRRAAFIAASIVIPVIANGVRALGIVVLGNILGSAEAAAADHLVYGWVFFSVVILLLIAAGLPFREDGAVEPIPPHSPVAPQPIVRRAGLAIVVAALAAIPLLAMAALDRSAAAAPLPFVPRLAGTTECRPDGVPRPLDAVPNGVVQRVACGAQMLTVASVGLPARANPASLAATLRAVTGEDDAEDAVFGTLETPDVVPRTWRLTETTKPARLIASSFWIDGVPSQAGLRGRLRQAVATFAGAASPPVLIAVSVDLGHDRASSEESRALRRVVAGFLDAQSGLDEQIRGTR